MKTKENGKNIYMMMKTLQRNRRSIHAFMKKEIKDTKRQTNAWRTVKQFLIVFLSTIGDQAIL